MENIRIKDKIDLTDLKETLRYYGNHLLYAILIGSSVIAISRNYRKAIMNEDLYSMYKNYKKMSDQQDFDASDII